MKVLLEKLADEPQWMHIRGYREDRKLRKAELLLELKKKAYWFPISPSVYSRFESMAKSDSRLKALRYLQRYIRRYKGYKNKWPSKRYVKSGKMPRNSFMNEAAVDKLINARLRMNEIMSNDGSSRQFVTMSRYQTGSSKFVRVAKQKPRSKRVAATSASFSG